MKKILFFLLLVFIKQVNAQFCFKAGVNYPTGSTPFSVCSADFNGDGFKDLAVANSGANDVSILLNNGSGGFTLWVNLAVGTTPESITSADFNGDGKADLAVANYGANSISVLLGTGTGGFGAATTVAVGSTPFSIISADFNGDGKADVATANYGSSNVSVLLGNGSGGFGGLANFVVGTYPKSVISGDFNLDGRLDLATANYGSSNLSVLFGTGSGNFGGVSNYAVGPNPHSVATADFNGDGNLDLVATIYGTGNISVLLGTGGGVFGAASNFVTSPTPGSLVIADFDGDGLKDVATVDPASSNSVYIFKSTGTGNFLPNQTFLIGGNAPYSVISADFNNDGRPDLATANNGTNNASVLLNNIPNVSISGNTTICAGNNTTLVASGANSFGWNPSGTISVSGTGTNTETVTATPFANTTYTVTGTNTGCSITPTATVTINVNALPILTTNNPTVCIGTTATLTVSGASTYTWSTGGVGSSISLNTSVNRTDTVIGTDGNGCKNIAVANITVNLLPNVTVNNATICANNITTLTAAGAFTYTWSTGSNNAVINPFPSSNTNYTVTGTDGNGCVNTAVSIVSVNPIPTVLINGMNNSVSNLCTGSSILLTASGANTYTWSANAGSATTPTVSVGPTTFTTYFVTGTDINGCQNSNSMGVLVYALPGVSVNSATVCIGSPATLIANGANTYTWSTSATTSSITITPTVTANYTVTGTDANGCINTATATVTAPANPMPFICFLTADSLAINNIVYWDKTQSPNADSFVVFRYDAFSSTYFRIGAVPKDSGHFIDTQRNIAGPNGGDPQYGSWQYKLAVIDTCGNLSALSPYHQSVFVQENSQNFNWNAYVIETGQSNPVSGYSFLRDDNNTGNWQVLLNTSSTLATDPNYNLYPNGNWRVDALGFICTATFFRNGNNNTQSTVVKSKSNIQNNRTTKINLTATNSTILVYPNPANGELMINLSNNCNNCAIEIINMLGQSVKNISVTNTESKISVADLQNGVYYLKVSSSNNLQYLQKLVVQH